MAFVRRIPQSDFVPRVPFHRVVILFALAFSLGFGNFGTDRRVVDTVEAGNPQSEALHGYIGHDDLAGVAHGKPFRQARGWMRYALATFDDTEVTVACTFLVTDTVPRSYDLIVEDSLIATRRFAPTPTATVVAEQVVPFVLTRGKANITVVIRARDGLTPAVHEIRTVQDHNEVNPPGVAR